MSKKISVALLVLGGAVFMMLVNHQQIHAQTGSTYWSIQSGTAQDDCANGIATDSSGNVYVAGFTDGNLYGTNLGSEDCFIVKYNSSGIVQWTKQIGTAQSDTCTVSVDKSDNVYVAGNTSGNLFGTNAGGSDAFLAKYTPNGTLLWSKQFGTSADDGISDLAIDANNNIYASGSTIGSLFGTNTGPNYDGAPATDAFLAKFDTNGNLLWGTQYGADNRDYASAVTTDTQGNAYVVGDTNAGSNKQLFGPVPGSSEAYVAKFSPIGVLMWGKDIGTRGGNSAYCVCADATGNVYVGGNLNSGDTDFPSQGFVTKFDTNGNPLWLASDTISADDSGTLVTGIRLNPQGQIVAAGYTNGSLFAPNIGGKDVFLASYDQSGNLLWGRQYGSSSDDALNSLTIDNQGSIYLAGDTFGSLFGTNAGGDDAFIQKLSPTGQMAKAKNRSIFPYKSLLFAWSGQTINLSYPPVLANKKPYVYAGYLCSGIPGAKVQKLASGRLAILGPSKQVLIDSHSLTYQINGKPRQMSAKPVLVNGQCYVPLDVMKAVLPYPVSYEAKVQRVRFDPPQKKVASR